jgi:hypothetical protein
MKKLMGMAALLGAGAALAMPAGASAETVCVGNNYSLGACYTVDAACVVGSLKGNQYFAPCIRGEIYREFEPPGGEI